MRAVLTGLSKKERPSSSPEISRLAAISPHYKSPETNSPPVAEIGDPSGGWLTDLTCVRIFGAGQFKVHLERFSGNNHGIIP